MHLPIFSVLASIILTPTNFSRDVLAQPVDNETLHQATGVLKDHVTLLSDNSSHDPFIQIRADGLLRRGIEHFQSGRFHQALESWQSALELYRTINDRLGEARALGNSGVVYRNLGQYEQAIESLDQHLAIARELGNLTEEGKALAHLGNVYLDLVRYQQATGRN